MAKRRASAAQRARLTALRRKYGLGEFKGRSIVPKRRRSTGSQMAKRRRSSGKRGGMFSGSALGTPVMSGVVYAFISPLISKVTAKFGVGVQDEILQIGAALVLSQVVKNQLVKNYANAAIIVNTARLVDKYVNPAQLIAPPGGGGRAGSAAPPAISYGGSY